jgi:hypothetical protein
VARINFDAFQYEQDKAEFLEAFRHLIASFFGEEQAPQLTTLASNEHAKNLSKTSLEKALDALPEFVFEGKWDVANGDLETDLDFWLRACEGLLEVPNLRQLGDWSEDFDRIVKTAHARARIHSDGIADFEDLARLADMSVASVKNAQYTKGEDRLVVGEDGWIKSEDAWRWLQGRRNFIPTRLYDSRFSTLEPIKELKSFEELKNMLRGRRRAMQVTAQQLTEAFNGALSVEVVEREFCREYYGDYSSPDALDIVAFSDVFQPVVLANLARLLNLNPSWFVITATKLTVEALTKHLQQEVEQSARQALADMGLPDEWSSANPVDPDEIPTADKIRQTLTSTPGLAYHPKFKKGNAKIEAYMTESGRTIAHEYNLRNQALWIRMEGLDKEDGKALLDMPHSLGRGTHSGLAKYPELADGRLGTFHPRSMAQVTQIVNAIMTAQPLANETEEDS